MANLTLTGLVCAGMLLRLAVSVVTVTVPGSAVALLVLADTLSNGRDS